MLRYLIKLACGTAIRAADLVLQSRGLQTWPLLEYPPPEPFAGWIEKRMQQGRERVKERRNRKLYVFEFQQTRTYA